ncbi:MAG: hypothetical protein MRJ96_07655 [Nitrospirales bacterium]|nr:hypothetical protein [Nitrospira sp.]MDR4501308.1 hypothetical protein [Nitrospirales bacterium]
MSRAFPRETKIDGEVYRYERVLKDDFFSMNLLYRNTHGQGYVLKLSDFRFIGGILFRPLACLISRHEYRVYQRIADIEGIPTLGPRWGWRGYFHHYIEGKTLHEITPKDHLPDSFFDRLKKILQQVHARRVFYVDLNKQGNVICSTNGQPYLIDFQISLAFPGDGTLMGKMLDRIFNRLIQEDFYHLYKHKKAFQPQGMTEDELRWARRSKLNARYSRYLLRPYLRIKRRLYPHGSNEVIWYRWKKLKDKSVQMP